MSRRLRLATGPVRCCNERDGLLSDWNFDSMEVNALFVSDKTIKPVARAFAAFLL